MPTYTCWSEQGVIDEQARARVARALTEIHHEVAVGPRYFVQVVFNDLTSGAIFLAGEPAPREHVWVRADIRSGRSPEQKKGLLDRITREVGQIAGVDPTHVWVYINDIPGSDIAEHGRPLPDPGQEDAWFAALPQDLQDRLERLK